MEFGRFCIIFCLKKTEATNSNILIWYAWISLSCVLSQTVWCLMFDYVVLIIERSWCVWGENESILWHYLFVFSITCADWRRRWEVGAAEKRKGKNGKLTNQHFNCGLFDFLASLSPFVVISLLTRCFVCADGGDCMCE